MANFFTNLNKNYAKLSANFGGEMKHKPKVVFPQLFRVLPNFHECVLQQLYGKQKRKFYFFQKINPQKIFFSQSVMTNGFQPIIGRKVYELWKRIIHM